MEVKNGCEDKVDVKPGPHCYQAWWAGLDCAALRRRVSRPGKNCAWRRAGMHTQERQPRGKDKGCGWQWRGWWVQRSGQSRARGSKRERGRPQGRGCLPSALLWPGGCVQPVINCAQRKSVTPTR